MSWSWKLPQQLATPKTPSLLFNNLSWSSGRSLAYVNKNQVLVVPGPGAAGKPLVVNTQQMVNVTQAKYIFVGEAEYLASVSAGSCAATALAQQRRLSRPVPRPPLFAAVHTLSARGLFALLGARRSCPPLGSRSGRTTASRWCTFCPSHPSRSAPRATTAAASSG